MKRSSFAVLSVIFDAVLVNAGFVLAFLIRFSGELPAHNFSAYLILAPLITVIFVAACWVNDLYNPTALADIWTIIRKTVLSVTIATLVTMVVAFLGGAATASLARLSLLIAYVLIALLLILWRYLFMRFGSIRWPRQNVLVLGTGQTALDIVDELEARSHRGWRCAGLISDGTFDEVPEKYHAYIKDNGETVIEILKELKPDRLIVSSPSSQRELIEQITLDIDISVRIDVVPDVYEVFLGEFDSTLGDIPLVHVAGAKKPGYFEVFKRTLDIILSLLGLIITSPFLLIAFLAVKLGDRGPFFYRQERVGKDGKPFKVFKIRTMKVDAEKLSGPVLASDDDPRITKVGNVLRTYRIDEIPQLLNILIGEMSFVGPRPEREFFVKDYIKTIPGYRERFMIKPGATGLAQINGGYATDAERKLKYDLIYLYHRNIGLDLRILVETLKVVFTGKGAR